ncbi:MAG: enolase C-terminal domain-like protein [Candidatus Caldarchaeum sp.]|uniref:Enolase n=1 Tax=Caldiarchaeum subterraneum TaxID=311458 RepID=A0A7C5L887_CALS0
MRASFKITDANAIMVFDSRGSETVEVELWSEKVSARVSAPSGKSRGSREAVPFSSNEVKKSLEAFRKVLKSRLIGFDAADQLGLDTMLKEVDGTENFSNLGGNLAYAVSACAIVLTSRLRDIAPWRYIAELSGIKPAIPLPLGNVLGGGAHAGAGSPDIQEFLVFPSRPKTVEEAVKTNIEVHRRLGNILMNKAGRYGGGKGDEGGYAPPLDDIAALQSVAEASEGLSVGLGLDVAASSLYDVSAKRYVYRNRGERKTVKEQMDYIAGLVERYRIRYVEDPFDESDFESFTRLCDAFPKLLVCGDDLVVTRPELVRKAAESGAVRAVILKPNQVGTVSDTIKAAVEAERHGIVRVVSHRSGETCDSFLSHLAIGLGGKFIKAGVVGGERVAKLNELLRIHQTDGSLHLQEVDLD